MSDTRVTATPTTIVSEFDSVLMTLAEMNSANESDERDAMRDEREAVRAAGELKLGQMKEAADFALASGCVSGGVAIASACAGGSEEFSKALDGCGKATTAALDRFGADANIRSELADMALERARGRAEENRADAEAAGRAMEKAADGLSTALSERRRAEEAGTRA